MFFKCLIFLLLSVSLSFVLGVFSGLLLFATSNPNPQVPDFHLLPPEYPPASASLPQHPILIPTRIPYTTMEISQNTWHYLLSGLFALVGVGLAFILLVFMFFQPVVEGFTRSLFGLRPKISNLEYLEWLGWQKAVRENARLPGWAQARMAELEEKLGQQGTHKVWWLRLWAFRKSAKGPLLPSSAPSAGSTLSVQSEANNNRLLKAILDELRRGNAGFTAGNSPESSPFSVTTRRQRAPVLPPVGSTGTDLNAFTVRAFQRAASGALPASKASE